MAFWSHSSQNSPQKACSDCGELLAFVMPSSRIPVNNELCPRERSMKVPILRKTTAKCVLAMVSALLGLSSQAAEITYEGFAKVERFDNVTGGLNGLITN